MANGPLGGFMPTPAAPAQPPQVKLDTTADSRGNFNNFLKSMNGALSVNPPVMAPAMGAMAPNMAPALANIDIFNQPVQMMQEGGVADFGDFFDEVTSVADDDRSDLSDDNIDDSPPDSDMDYTDVFTPDELQQATDIGRATSDSTSDGTTIANQNVKFTDLNQNQINEIKSQIDNRNMVALTEEDEFFKDGNLTAAGEAELNKRNAADLQLVSSGQVLPSEYLSTVSDILGTGEKNVMDAVNLDKPVDFQEIVTNPRIGSPALAGLPGVKSRFNTQKQTIPDVPVLAPRTQFARNVEDQRAAERGRALGPTTMDDSLDILDTFMTDQRVQELLNRGAEAQRIKDIENRENRVQELLDRGARAQETKDLLDRLDQDTIAENLDKDAPTRTVNRASGTTTELDSEFGDVFPTVDPFAIGAPKVQALLNKTNLMPQATGFKVGKTTIPSLASGINALLSGGTDMMNKRIYDGITKKGQTPVYDPVTGKITGSRDARSGVLMEGMDFAEQDRATSDNETTPIIRPIVAPKEEEPKADLPPNIIGGTDPVVTLPVEPTTVVPSPFAPASSAINPITFDSGDLNKLIEMLTGVAGKPVVSAKKGGLISMANGGLIKAVDDFLAAG